MADEAGTPSDSGLVIIGFLESDGSFGVLQKLEVLQMDLLYCKR